MCGIAGFAGFQDADLLRRMTDAIRHRGPDDEGRRVDGDVSLGMRRLSIIDLAGGHQPISNEDGTIWIVFNGEIYNHPELRRELEALGHRYATNSDTESIVHAYEQWGDDCVTRLRGMFGFAIWDAPKKRLLLARDHVGIKPLHYAVLGDRLLFGSEIKSILEHHEIKRELDPQALHDYLGFLYVPAPRTIFKGVSKLPPGHTLVWHEGKATVRRYWRVTFPDRPLTDAREAVRRTRELLEESVRMHMLSDVPMGVYLSGGIDSGVITALMARASPEPVRTFTVGFSDSDYDESAHARVVAEHVGAEHREITLEADTFKLLPDIVRQHDEPFGNSTSAIHYLISKEIARHVKVAMSGAGGDEVFAGYPKYHAMRWSEAYNRAPRTLRRALVEWPLSRLKEGTGQRDYVRWGRQFTAAAHLPAPDRYHSLVTYMDEDEKRRLYAPDHAERVGAHDSRDVTRAHWKDAGTTDTEQAVFHAEFQGFLPDNILTYGDRTSMAASLEARVPLLDWRLVEHAASVSPRVRMQGTKLKPLLKAAARDLLPRSILDRKKMGFNPPTGAWIRDDGAWLVEEYLHRGRLEREGIFASDEVERMLAEHRAGRRNNGLRLWGLIMFEAWHREYLDGRGGGA